MTDSSGTPIIEGFTDFQVIGRGGFSTVYSAVQTAFGRRVAVKVLSLTGSESRLLDREIRALGELADIPNVVQAHQVTVTTDGRPALVMTLMPTSMAKLVRSNGAVPLDLVRRWSGQLSRALHGAHQLGVFHRDIKPENILISSYEDAYIADFGISALESMEAQTATAMSLSPPNAPPERLQGDNGDPRLGDVYSLASTVYTALSGHPPFGTSKEGGVHGLVSRILSTELPSDPLITEPVYKVLQRAMAKEPLDRYPTVEDFGAELDKAFSSAGFPETAPSTTGQGVGLPPEIADAGRSLTTDGSDDNDDDRTVFVSQPSVSTPTSTTKDEASLGNRVLIGVGLATIVVVGLLIAWLVMRGDSDEHSTTAGPTSTTSTTSPDVEATGPFVSDPSTDTNISDPSSTAPAGSMNIEFPSSTSYACPEFQSGRWTGVWASRTYALSGTVDAMVISDRGEVSGSLNLLDTNGKPVMSSTDMKGQIRCDKLVLSLDNEALLLSGYFSPDGQEFDGEFVASLNGGEIRSDGDFTLSFTGQTR